MDYGRNQIAMLSAAEAAYGETVGTPAWATLGIIEGGEMSSKTQINDIVGIGSDTPQGRWPDAVDNEVRVDLAVPTAAQMNKAITRTSGELASYNILVGDTATAGRGVGLKWNRLQGKIPEKGIFSATLDGIFKSLLAATVSEAVALASTPVIWRRDGLVLTVGGSEDEDLIAMDFSVNNNLERKGVDNAVANQARVLKYLVEGKCDIEATIQTMSRPSFNLEADTFGCAAADVDVVATFTDLCGGGTPGTLVITLTDGQYIEKRAPLVPGKGVDYSIALKFKSITIA